MNGNLNKPQARKPRMRPLSALWLCEGWIGVTAGEAYATWKQQGVSWAEYHARHAVQTNGGW